MTGEKKILCVGGHLDGDYVCESDHHVMVCHVGANDISMFHPDAPQSAAPLRLVRYEKRSVIKYYTKKNTTRRIIGDEVYLTDWEVKYSESAVIYVAETYLGATPTTGIDFDEPRLVSRTRTVVRHKWGQI